MLLLNATKFAQKQLPALISGSMPARPSNEPVTQLSPHSLPPRVLPEHAFAAPPAEDWSLGRICEYVWGTNVAVNANQEVVQPFIRKLLLSKHEEMNPSHDGSNIT
jgi:hypothetical protein